MARRFHVQPPYPRTVRARWLVGADGANSALREGLGITRRDLGFRERWFVVDVEPADMMALDLPAGCQLCDPRRPTTHIPRVTRPRRWALSVRSTVLRLS